MGKLYTTLVPLESSSLWETPLSLWANMPYAPSSCFRPGRYVRCALPRVASVFPSQGLNVSWKYGRDDNIILPALLGVDERGDRRRTDILCNAPLHGARVESTPTHAFSQACLHSRLALLEQQGRRWGAVSYARRNGLPFTRWFSEPFLAKTVDGRRGKKGFAT